jgi:hypothetical protein
MTWAQTADEIVVQIADFIQLLSGMQTGEIDDQDKQDHAE